MGKLSTNFDKIVLSQERTNASQFIDYANSHAIQSIHITKKCENEQYDLNFLNDIKRPEQIKKLILPTRIADLNIIHRFQNLEYLVVYPEQNQIIDLICFSKLKKLFTNCSDHFINADKIKIELLSLDGKGCLLHGIEQFESVKEIYLSKIKNFDFNKIAPLINLKRIVLSQLNIQNLNGIGQLDNLNYLHIEYAPSLESVCELSHLKNLTALLLYGCPKLTDVSEIGKCPSLKKIELEKIGQCDLTVLGGIQTLEKAILSNCGSIPSLKFIENLTNLQFLSFVDTNILDGDLTPCLRLKYAGTLDKRHYNLKNDELPGHKNFKTP